MRGRSAELGTVEALIDAARTGEGSSLLIVGEAGIGKTTLLAHAQAYAREMSILEARCFPSEREIPGTVLHDLLRGHSATVEELPEAQRDALRAVLALDQPRMAPHLLHAAVLNMLVGIASSAPILVTVEDVHWSDPLSAEVLAFAARRLRSERIAFIITTRTTDDLPFSAEGLTRLDLGPLDDMASREVVSDTSPEIDPGSLDDLIAAGGGNPLALIELTRTLLPSSDGLMTALPVSDLLERSFGAQLDPLSHDQRQAALVIAVGSGLHVEVVRRAFGLLGLDASTEDALIESGLVESTRDGIGFRHPVIQTVARGRADPNTLRSVHRALAAALEERGLEDQATWHMGLGADAPNEAIAVRMEGFAVRTLRTEAPTAARAFEVAGRLSETPAGEARRLLSAAEARLKSGHMDAVEALLKKVGSSADAAVSARFHATRGRLAAARGDAVGAATDLTTASRLADDAETAALTAVEASEQLILARDLDAAEESARFAVDQAGPVRPEVQIVVGLRFADVLGWRGDPSANGRWLEVASLAKDSPEILDDPMTTFYVAEALMSAGEVRRAKAMCLRAADSARTQGLIGTLPYILSYLTFALVALGELAQAETVAVETLDLATDLGQAVRIAESHGTLALIASLREDTASFDLHVAGTARMNHILSYTFGATARGFMAMSRGRYDEAADAFTDAARISLERGSGDAMYFAPRVPNLIEASYLAGRLDQANDLLSVFSEQAEKSGRPLPQALASRCAGILAPDESMEEHFQSALRWHEKDDPHPIDQGRTELWFGRRLRRAKRKSEARAHLRAALSLLEPCGARMWSSQATAELQASGETARPREPSTMLRLTPQERQVAALAGEALSTKAVAERLFLSPKTIETHLSSIYRKLQIRSRAELVRLVSDGAIDA